MGMHGIAGVDAGARFMGISDAMDDAGSVAEIAPCVSRHHATVNTPFVMLCEGRMTKSFKR